MSATPLSSPRGTTQLHVWIDRIQAGDLSARDAPADLARWEAFHEEVNRLPEEEREVFNLLYYAGRTQEEAAAILDISASTVFRRWTAARLTLKSRLGEGGE